MTRRLRDSIIIQTPTIALDSEGIASKAWGTFATVQAAIKPVSGREYVAAGGVMPGNQVIFLIRYISGILPTMRISYGSKYYNIVSIANIDNRSRELEIVANEVI